MNILFISKLSGNLCSGPNNSVPAQIKAQSEVDNIFWYNINKIKLSEWGSIGCKNLVDYPGCRLRDLPTPFDRPDIAVVEEFCCYVFSGIINDLISKNIPYVIIPRSQLTAGAQKKKQLKKIIGNMIYLNKFFNNSCAIQYLSVQEQDESKNRWNNKYSYVIPNGVYQKEKTKESFSSDKLKVVYIGRYERYQKGFDFLLESISRNKSVLRKANFVLNMYGTGRNDATSILKDEMQRLEISDLVNVNDCVFGDEKEKVLLESDVFILTSRFEGMPMGLIEALSYGLPCLVTKGTNLSREVDEYSAGWIADNSIESVEKALLNMVQERMLLADKSKNAVALAKNYSWHSIALQSHDMYLDLISHKKR